ncbi:MAG TPA: hypothetical protein VNK94_04685 [Gaiellaceae bacterium]|nr:hypothetical protein [Gaiellaceae bacterium]
MNPGASIIRGLRRRGDEPQLTRALASVFQCDPSMAGQFMNVVLPAVDRDRALVAPTEMDCSTEEVVKDGRLDLRFRADGWDVIVELKIYAGYGRNWLDRYLSVLEGVDHAYVAAITRSVPRYGEPERGIDRRWLGSVQWHRLLPGLRAIQSVDDHLSREWQLFLGVLEEEGSMGFTKANPELFELFGRLRETRKHIDEFVEALQMPLLEALIKALGGDERAASVYKTKGGRMHVARSWNGITDTIFLVPAGGPQRIRAGVFAYNPPVRFFVAPKNGRAWVARLAKLSPEANDAVKALVARGFRDHDLHAFLELDEQRLMSSTLEEEVVDWAYARFVDIVESGLLACTVGPVGSAELEDGMDDPE